MRAEKLKTLFQDEIRESCQQCGMERLMAYWDEELEYYIYLSDSKICHNCQTLI
jgi:RNA polymerase subunit RPABC4/transcription elongation factor Spt4